MAVPFLVACRFGFELTPDAAPDAPAPVLACGPGPTFSIDAEAILLTAIATADGYDVFTVDPAGAVHGFVYELTPSELILRVRDVPVAQGASGPVAAIAIGTDVLLAVPTADGTQLVPLDAALAARGAGTAYGGWFSGTLARTASGAIGLVGAVGTDETNTRIEARILRPDGSTELGPLPVVDQPEHPSVPTVIASDDDVLVVWSASTPTPNQVRATVLTPGASGFGTKLTATIISVDTQRDAQAPRAAYSAAKGAYAVAWFQKSATTGDELWVSVRDPKLAGVGPAMLLGTGGVSPLIAAGDHDFLAAWVANPAPATAGFNPFSLGAARVAPDGSVTPLSIPASGNTVSGYDVVSHHGQPALVWAEVDASNARTIRFDPLCD